MAITLVNSGASSKSGTGAFTYTTGWTPAAGNMLCVVLLSVDGAAWVRTLSDSVNSYSNIINNTPGGSTSASVSAWFCKLSTTAALTLSFSTTTGSDTSGNLAYALEFSGITGAYQGIAGTGTGHSSSGTAMTANAVTTTQAASVVVGAFADTGGSGSYTQSGSWLIAGQENNFGTCIVYQILSATGTNTPAVTQSSTSVTNWGYGFSLSGTASVGSPVGSGMPVFFRG